MRTIEEDSSGLGHTLSHDARPSMFEVKLPLRDRLGSDDMSANMLLDSIGNTDLEVIGVHTIEVLRHDDDDD